MLVQSHLPGYTGSTNVVVKGNTTVDGDVFGAGKNAGADKTYVETRGGFYNNIYGGGETGYAKSVEIRICNTESAFAYDIKGEINGLPKNTASTEEIARNRLSFVIINKTWRKNDTMR